MPSTRRETLAAVGGSLALLAGCAGSNSSSQRVPAEPRGEPVDYEYEKVRDPSGDPLYVRARDEAERTTRTPRSQPSEVVTERAGLSEYDFAPGPGQTLRAFAAATDFETRSVFLTGVRIGECFEQRLQGVRMENDHPHFAFCRALRPADVACRADRRVMVAFAIRVPLPDGANGYGASSGRCDQPVRPPAFDPTTSEDDA